MCTYICINYVLRIITSVYECSMYVMSRVWLLVCTFEHVFFLCAYRCTTAATLPHLCHFFHFVRFFGKWFVRLLLFLPLLPLVTWCTGRSSGLTLCNQWKPFSRTSLATLRNSSLLRRKKLKVTKKQKQKTKNKKQNQLDSWKTQQKHHMPPTEQVCCNVVHLHNSNKQIP